MSFTSECQQLVELSAEIGSRIDLIQGAGGNTSVKDDSTLFIKASGTWLSEARQKDIFVRIDRSKLQSLLSADKGEDLSSLGSGLRPSIETSFHEVIPARVVVHVHSLRTLAFAMRKDAAQLLSPILRDFSWSFVPYVKPGWPLTKRIVELGAHNSEVIVLGNHGLIVAAATVQAAQKLLEQVEGRLQAALGNLQVELPFSEEQSQPDTWTRMKSPLITRLASTSAGLAFLECGVLYPDQVVFLGPQFPCVASENELSSLKGALVAAVRGSGVFLAPGVKQGTLEQLKGHALLFSMLSENHSSLCSLAASEIQELTTWDAEKYRQSTAR